MVPGVKVLALKVNLGVSKEVKMMTSFLACFPNVERLHIESVVADDGPAGQQQHPSKVWKEVCRVDCLKSHVKKVLLHQFRGDQAELDFIKFIGRSALQLQALLVVLTPEDYAKPDKVNELTRKLRDHSGVPWACKYGFLLVVGPKLPNVWKWSFRKASDLAEDDPFAS